MRIIDTTGYIPSYFDPRCFRLADWETYMDAAAPGAKSVCLDDMRECIGSGCSWDNDFLPALNAALRDTDKRREAVSSFHAVTDGLDEKIARRFGRTLDADLILYLGLCSGAGWVTTVSGNIAVLFGIEKIMELDWHAAGAMTGLVLHELGHVCHSRFGVLPPKPLSLPDRFLRQLFTEGVAMVFEQEMIGDTGYFHQYGAQWKQWCDDNAEHIRQSFYDDLRTMTPSDQRYFGDWVSFEGHSDTGYYLGARFVRSLMRSDSFDSVICYDLGRVKDGFERFMRSDMLAPAQQA